jgi:Asp-tRNA(Asn)/Glu-tRNA(Gln) amidotransferase A subunit family amidase
LLIERMAKRTAEVDAMVMPAVPMVAPTLVELESADPAVVIRRFAT